MSSDWERVNDDTERLRVPGGWTYMRGDKTWFVPAPDDQDDGAYGLPPEAYEPNSRPVGDGILPGQHRGQSGHAHFRDGYSNKVNRYGHVERGAPLSEDGVEGQWGIGRPPEISVTSTDEAVAERVTRGTGVNARKYLLEQEAEWKRRNPGVPWRGSKK